MRFGCGSIQRQPHVRVRVKEDFLGRGAEVADLHRAEGHRGVATRCDALQTGAVSAIDISGGLACIIDGERPVFGVFLR